MVEGYQNSLLSPHNYFNPMYVDVKKAKRNEVKLNNRRYYEALREFGDAACKCLNSNKDPDNMRAVLNALIPMLHFVPQNHVKAFIQGRSPFTRDALYQIETKGNFFLGSICLSYIIASEFSIDYYFCGGGTPGNTFNSIDGKVWTVKKMFEREAFKPLNQDDRHSTISGIVAECFKYLHSLDTNSISSLGFENPFNDLVKGTISEDTFDDCVRLLESDEAVLNNPALYGLPPIVTSYGRMSENDIGLWQIVLKTLEGEKPFHLLERAVSGLKWNSNEKAALMGIQRETYDRNKPVEYKNQNRRRH